MGDVPMGRRKKGSEATLNDEEKNHLRLANGERPSPGIKLWQGIASGIFISGGIWQIFQWIATAMNYIQEALK
jgi:hypothetical protein